MFRISLEGGGGAARNGRYGFGFDAALGRPGMRKVGGSRVQQEDGAREPQAERFAESGVVDAKRVVDRVGVVSVGVVVGCVVRVRVRLARVPLPAGVVPDRVRQRRLLREKQQKYATELHHAANEGGSGHVPGRNRASGV